MVGMGVVVLDEKGFVQKVIDMTILENYYAIIVTFKRAEEKGVILVVGIAVWGV